MSAHLRCMQWKVMHTHRLTSAIACCSFGTAASFSWAGSTSCKGESRERGTYIHECTSSMHAREGHAYTQTYLSHCLLLIWHCRRLGREHVLQGRTKREGAYTHECTSSRLLMHARSCIHTDLTYYVLQRRAERGRLK